MKADAAPSPERAGTWAPSGTGTPETFIAGVVLHTGPQTYRLGDRIVAAPISSLWA